MLSICVNFFFLNLVQVNPKSPDFVEQYESTVQQMQVVITDMRAHLEQSAILSILAFVEQVNVKLAQLTPEQEQMAEDSPAEPGDSTSRTTTTSQKKADSSSEQTSKDKTKTKVMGEYMYGILQLILPECH